MAKTIATAATINTLTKTFGAPSDVDGVLLFSHDNGFGIAVYGSSIHIAWHEADRDLWWRFGDVEHRLPEGTWDNKNCFPSWSDSFPFNHNMTQQEWLDLAIAQVKSK